MSMHTRSCTHIHSVAQAAGEAALAKLDTGLAEFQAIIDAKDKQAVPIKQRECLEYVGAAEEAMVKGFPFDVPAQYAQRPLLKVWTYISLLPPLYHPYHPHQSRSSCRLSVMAGYSTDMVFCGAGQGRGLGAMASIHTVPSHHHYC